MSTDYPKSSENVTDRIDFVDTARGIGIILVIWSHTCVPLMSWSSPFFIPLFYVLGGYCTSHAVNIRKKAITLMVPYVFFAVILLVVCRYYKLIHLIGIVYSRRSLYPWGSTPNVILLDAGNCTLWFITSLFVSYCLFAIIQKSGRPMLMTVCYVIITYVLTFSPILLPWSIDTAFLTAIFIYYGTIIREKSLIQRTNYYWDIGLLCVYILFWRCCGVVNISVRMYGIHLLMLLPTALIGTFLLMKASFCLKMNTLRRIFLEIGRNSLTIFALHMPVVSLWNHLTAKLGIHMPELYDGIFCMIFVIAVLYPVSRLFSRYLFGPILAHTT